jgi:hypothetical protein
MKSHFLVPTPRAARLRRAAAIKFYERDRLERRR